MASRSDSTGRIAPRIAATGSSMQSRQDGSGQYQLGRRKLAHGDLDQEIRDTPGDAEADEEEERATVHRAILLPTHPSVQIESVHDFAKPRLHYRPATASGPARAGAARHRRRDRQCDAPDPLGGVAAAGRSVAGGRRTAPREARPRGSAHWTGAGALSHAVVVHEQLERARADLAAWNEGTIGEVRVGALSTGLTSLVAPAFSRLAAERPGDRPQDRTVRATRGVQRARPG